jgi:LuxR family transcriptional regulator, maltose regulon positive regulatory protein
MPHPTPSPLLETKLYPGRGARAPLARPRLDLPAAVIDGTATVVSIVAPAGYGKSTLMAGWFAAWPHPRRAWVNLDDDDNDPRRLLRYLVGALQAVDAAIGSDALAQLSGDGHILPAAVLESLAIDLARDDRRLVLFLDDVHVLVGDEALKVVDWLVNFAPRSVQFVLGSREAPRLRLGTLRLHGRMIELDQRQLAFDHAEMERICRTRLPAALSPSSLVQLEQTTEGWPAALEFAMLALEGETDPAALIDTFAGTDRSVVEYLREVLLDRLDPGSRRLLHQIAQFDRICAPLARAATGSEAGEALLASAHARNLFLIALDRRGEWYRFHNLVGDYLRHHLPPGHGTAARAALVAGALWFDERGHREDAIACAIRAEDWERASAWVAEAAEDTSQRLGSHALMLRWMREIPRPWLDRHPFIGLSYAYSLAFTTRTAELDAEVQRLEGILDGWAADPAIGAGRTDALRCALGLQQLVMLTVRDQGRATHAAATEWLQRWPNAPLRLAGDAANTLAWGCKSVGEIDAGFAAAGRAREILARDQSYHGLSWNAIIEALLCLKRGDHAAARAACERGLALVRERLNGHREHTGFMHAILGAIAYEFDEIAAAEQHADLAAVHIDAAGPADLLILAYLTQARLMFRRHDKSAGFAALHLGRQVGRRRGLRRVDVTLATEECIWLCRAGDRTDALALAAQFGFDRAVFAERDLIADKASRVGPRLLLPVSPEMAVAQLGEPLVRSAERGFHHRRAELLVLQAAALLRAGRDDEAMSAWHEAIKLGERFGYRRVFLDEPEIVHAMTALLRSRPEAESQPAWLTPKGGKAAAGAELPSAEALTRKEHRILRQLESGLSNREIAASMFISEGTLKWHLHNVYRKLECKNRTGALATARKLGLVGP